jgi:hypothetical protein
LGGEHGAPIALSGDSWPSPASLFSAGVSSAAYLLPFLEAGLGSWVGGRGRANSGIIAKKLGGDLNYLITGPAFSVSYAASPRLFHYNFICGRWHGGSRPLFTGLLSLPGPFPGGDLWVVGPLLPSAVSVFELR